MAQSSRGSRRSFDWVQTLEGYDFSTTEVPLSSAGALNTLMFPLHLWGAQGTDLPGQFEDGQYVCKRVRGCVLWWQPGTPPEIQYQRYLTLRVRLGDSEPATGTPVVPPVTYDLRDPVTANESFLWQDETPLFSLAGFWSEQAFRGRRFGRIDVDVKSQRRLEPFQQIQLAVQYSVAAGSLVGDRLEILPKLRVLLEAV